MAEIGIFPAARTSNLIRLVLNFILFFMVVFLHASTWVDGL
jgi:hypothetical protein